MEYIFILNKNAGSHHAIELQKELEKTYKGKIDYQIYFTKTKKDATNYIKNYCKTNPDKNSCFVACGGDGTINEVASGIIGEKNKSFAVLSYGSGNDFIKYYAGKDFLSLDKLFGGKQTQIDAIQVNDSYSVNVVNSGFEAKVGSIANDIKNKGGKNAYGRGIIKALFTSRKNNIQIKVDGEVITKEKMLLCSFANGKYHGGKYMCAPYAINDDGLMEVCLIHPISLFKFAKMLPHYKRGEHLDMDCIKNYRVYKRAKTAEIFSEKPTELTLDGETLQGTRFLIKILDKAVNFIIPAN